jgi:hypothetical protein
MEERLEEKSLDMASWGEAGSAENGKSMEKKLQTLPGRSIFSPFLKLLIVILPFTYV